MKKELKKFKFVFIEGGETHTQIIWAWVIDHAHGVFEFEHPAAILLAAVEG